MRSVADTYPQVHWYTGKLKTRCRRCHRVVFESRAEAKLRAAQISERTPMRAFRGKCGNWHVSGWQRGLK